MSDSTSDISKSNSSLAGVYFAFGAFGLWAIAPIFFKQIQYINPIEIVVHRAIWSVIVGVAIVLVMGRTSDIIRAFTTPKLLFTLMGSGALITVNWVLFIWAISVGLTLEASLAYYINPLLNVVIGMVLLNERLSRFQLIAVGLAVVGVVLQTISTGSIPWVALILPTTFALYGYVRKTVDVGPVQGFVVETTLMLPVSIGIAIWFAATGQAHFATNTYDTLMLMACGPVTAIPLMLFASAARRLRYSTIGILQYIAPTGMFFIAIFLFGETVNALKLLGFGFIWFALVIYTFDALRADRREKACAKKATSKML